MLRSISKQSGRGIRGVSPEEEKGRYCGKDDATVQHFSTFDITKQLTG